MADVIKSDQNTLYARRSYGLEPFTWAGKCTGVDRIVQEKGAMNPTFCQTAEGGLEVTGHTNGTPGLVTTTVMFKESTVEGLGDNLMTCLWDVDRRHHCKALPMWSAWDKVTRAVVGRATSVDQGGSTFMDDAEELVTSLPWSAVSQCVIRRTALSVQTFGGGS